VQGKVVFVSVSGGKDSALTLALALEKYKGTDTPVVALFCDTGWEHELTYRYIETLEEFFNIKIHKLVGIPLPELIRKKKVFPSPRRRFCTRSCKTVPTYRFYEEIFALFPFKIAEVWLGLRREESRARRNIKNYTHKAFEKTRFGERFPFDISYRYPIANLTERQVFEELRKRRVPINPLYEQGFKRVGCYPCFLSKKDIIQVICKALEGDEFSVNRLEEMKELDCSVMGRFNIDCDLSELIEKAKRKLEERKRKLEIKRLMLELPL
jgi:3'-phosphoadenosine 5'-phosphosulfate sulfotransferase (PAPS reductase)/FAD synthetase